MANTAIVKTISFLFGLLLFISNAGAQWGFIDSKSDSNIHRGIEYIYNLKYDSATIEFDAVVTRQPSHPAGYFFLAMVDWWRIAVDVEVKDYDNGFLKKIDKAIEVCDARLDPDEYDLVGLFFKGAAIGFRGQYYVKRDQYFRAASDGKTALELVERSRKLAPGNYDILLGTGIYMYMAAVIPDKYPLVKPFMMFFPEGNRELGLAQLRAASERAQYANIEAKYVLLQVNYHFEKNYSECLPLAASLAQRFPDNAVFERYLGRCYVQLGVSQQIAVVWGDIKRKCDERQIGYTTWAEREASYYLGIEAMNHLHFDSALALFYRTDELSRMLDNDGPSGFMALSNLKVGMIFDAQGKRDLALKQYDKVLSWKEYQNTHEQAEGYKKKGYGLNR